MSTSPPDPARTVLVTGGSGGIGRAASLRLARDGMQIAVHYAGNPARADEVVTAIRDGGGHAVAVGGDVSDPADVEQMFGKVEAELGGVDVVVNTAGIMVLGPIAEFTLEQFDRMVAINLRGTFLVSQQAVRRLRGGGALINFSSSVVGLALPTYSAYVATKGGVEAMTMVLAKEMRGRDVTVNAVAPGPTATPLFLDGKSQEQVDHMSAMSPLERLGQPDDIAETVAFLAGPGGRWVNGQVLRTNGGVV